MLIPPKYFLTPKISRLLASIEASKQVIDAITIPAEVEINIRRRSTLKSSLFSARIEGNTLTLEDISSRPSKDQKKAEVFNILKALNAIFQKRNKDLTVNDILHLHKMVMEGLTHKTAQGNIRNEISAIFNSAGIAVYMPPPPRLVASLLEKLIKFANSQKEQFVQIRACLAHYTFEKIHPFLDGNGRVGRLLLQAIMYKGGYGMKGLLTVEEYLDNNRSEYYRALEETERDVSYYLEFMLKAIAQTAEEAKNLVLAKKQIEAKDYLLPPSAQSRNLRHY